MEAKDKTWYVMQAELDLHIKRQPLLCHKTIILCRLHITPCHLHITLHIIIAC